MSRVSRLRRMVRAVGDLMIARGNVRGMVFWDECTYEAEPLRRLSRDSRRRLEEGTDALIIALKRRSAPEMRKAFARVERAWRDTHLALDGWDGVPAVLLPGDAALDQLRHITTEFSS